MLWGLAGTLSLAIASFAVRTVFVYALGVEYLGVNGLFTNVLAVLSFSELGIGAAINYALYKPISEGDQEKIKALMAFFKNAYRVIAVVVAVLGLALIPLLGYLVNTDISMSEIRMYYLVFLFNTVSSYFVIYKATYVNAIQKSYLVSNVDTLGTLVSYIAQTVAIVVSRSFLIYLLTSSVVLLTKNILMAFYFNRRFPVLKEKSSEKIDPKTRKTLWRNVKALVIHKIGDVSVHQTDNIIVSVAINTTTVGLLSNYTLITSLVRKMTNAVFDAFAASFGNLVAEDNLERRESVFDEFDLFGYILNGTVFVCCVSLVQPFVGLWLGQDLQLDKLTVFLLFLSVFLEGQTATVYQLKVADGRFKEDQWVAFFQAVVNLVISIIAAHFIGLPGVFAGTIVQRMIVVYVRPHIVYKYVFQKSTRRYYFRFFLRTLLICLVAFIGFKIAAALTVQLSVFSLAIAAFTSLLLSMLFFFCMYFRTKEFKALANRLRGRK